MDPNQQQQRQQSSSSRSPNHDHVQSRSSDEFLLSSTQDPNVTPFISQQLPSQSQPQHLQGSPYIKQEVDTAYYGGPQQGYPYNQQQQQQQRILLSQQQPQDQSQQQVAHSHHTPIQQSHLQPSPQQQQQQSKQQYYQYDYNNPPPQQQQQQQSSHERYSSQTQAVPQQYHLFQEGSSSQSQAYSPPAPQQQQQQPYYVSALPLVSESVPSQAHDSSPTSESPQQKRKRARKADHGVPGDKGDNELKQLAINNLSIPLVDLAFRIRQLENEEAITPPANAPHSKVEVQKVKENKERQRQLLGMVWLLKSCESSPTAVVPRNRIYARYSGMCADNSIIPLSPASFGKLVRILFPGLKTRRLGMRGQSKYHYCGIKLNNDQNFDNTPHSPQPQHILHRHKHSSSSFDFSFTGGSSRQQQTSPGSSSNSSVSYEESPLPSSHLRTPSYTPINSPSISHSVSIGHQLPSVSHLKYIPNLFNLINNGNYPSNSNPNLPLQLPEIYPYLKPDADYDLADTLFSLYKVHINTLFESLRFMQLRKFFSSFNSFNSILTTPVLKLYTSDSVMEWVKQCDIIMYKRMIRMLAKLQLQFSMPQDVISQLRQISSGYMRTLTNNLMNLKPSKTFVLMKLKLAKHFVNLLNRLIKIIETGQSASRILIDPIEKAAMIGDWKNLDIEEIVYHELPCNDRNISKLLTVLSEDFLTLLEFNGDAENKNEGESGDDDNKSNLDSIMIKFSNYIAEFPGKFPGTNPRLIILLTCNLLTTCLREISLSSGKGFGAWWILRCWVDEYLAWCLELGGFLQTEFISSSTSSSSDLEDTGAIRPGSSTFGGNLPGVGGASGSENLDQSSTGANFDLGTLDPNISFGPVDLLDGNYGNEDIDQEQVSNHTSAVAAATNEIILKYETNVEDMLS
ncbi:putative RFX-like DNA-binding protein [Scheffersomyces coipomensis]|uniref:putative RFX-like DNA-binding protein n=1 Tax=Scheffersomyces coipomensis TaxID=1788519 RepID=UPI00315CAC13